MENEAGTIAQALEAKKAAALQRLRYARAMQRQATNMEREAIRDLQEAEVADRVFKGLPRGSDDLRALQEAGDPERLAAELRARTAFLLSREQEEREAMLNSRGQKDMIVIAAVDLLRDGSWRTTEELTNAMLGQGLPISAANPQQRVSQVLSLDARFRTQRGKGWALVESPAQQELPIKEPDEWDENNRRKARRLVIGDDNAR